VKRFVEQWVHLVTTGVVHGQAITEAMVDEMVRNFNDPLPITVDFPHPDKQLQHFAAKLIAVKKHVDDDGIHLIGAVRTLRVHAAMLLDARDPRTGENLGAKLVDVAFVKGPATKDKVDQG
jgi:hypothetical protein